MNPFLFLILGLFLVLLEFYLPGMIMGISGGCFIIASIALFAYQSGSPVEVLLFVALAAIGLVGVVKFALWQIRGTKKAKSLYLDSDQTGYRASSVDLSTVGKIGTALTDLKPGGYILVDDKKYSAISVSGYISKGSEVEVISGQEERLNVKLHTKESSS